MPERRRFVSVLKTVDMLLSDQLLLTLRELVVAFKDARCGCRLGISAVFAINVNKLPLTLSSTQFVDRT